MSFILDAGSVLRVLAADPSDPFTQWIESNRICPAVANVTMAQALDTIRMDQNIEAADRRWLEKRYEALCRDLRNTSREAILTAEFDLKAADIFADLLSVEVAADHIGEIQLIPAAIAIQHNLSFVVSNNDRDTWDEFHNAWTDFSGAIPPEVGALTLTPFQPFASEASG